MWSNLFSLTLTHRKISLGNYSLCLSLSIYKFISLTYEYWTCIFITGRSAHDAFAAYPYMWVHHKLDSLSSRDTHFYKEDRNHQLDGFVYGLQVNVNDTTQRDSPLTMSYLRRWTYRKLMASMTVSSAKSRYIQLVRYTNHLRRSMAG